MSVAQFGAWDDGTDTRYELAVGQPIAMAPPTRRHVRMQANIASALTRQLSAPCSALQGGGTARDETDDEYRIPDVLVSCETGDGAYFEQPRLIVEILSPSTEKIDRTEKLDFYKSLPSVEAILLVWQDKRRLQLHWRDGEIWPARDLIGEGAITIPGLDLSLSVDEIYAGITDELPAEPEP